MKLAWLCTTCGWSKCIYEMYSLKIDFGHFVFIWFGRFYLHRQSIMLMQRNITSLLKTPASFLLINQRVSILCLPFSPSIYGTTGSPRSVDLCAMYGQNVSFISKQLSVNLDSLSCLASGPPSTMFKVVCMTVCVWKRSSEREREARR